MQPLSQAPNHGSDSDQEDNEDDKIVYPEGVVDKSPYTTIAQYRRAIGQSINFREQPLRVGEQQTETLILGLESFAQQHGCALSFDNEEHQFNNSIYRAAGGVVDLGSCHLLATDSLLTAMFEFQMDLDYSDITRSKDSVKKFVGDFCATISQKLPCDTETVRVFSIKRMNEQGKSEVKFGLTTPNMEKTKQLARDLQVQARSGFSKHTILGHVLRAQYEYTLEPALKFLKLRPEDLAPEHNYDYRQPGVPREDVRGSVPYYLPIGWYRHALRVVHKYGKDETWIGRKNAPGEWAVAYHGTKADAVIGIVNESLRTDLVQRDVMRAEAMQQIGSEAAQTGVYVATHCEGGSYPQYTKEFTVPVSPGKVEKFSVVFQCRVKPGTFTRHKHPNVIRQGEAWRFVDPHCVRPYGILLKKEP